MKNTEACQFVPFATCGGWYVWTSFKSARSAAKQCGGRPVRIDGNAWIVMHPKHTDLADGLALPFAAVACDDGIQTTLSR